ncbi:hypothetical protein NQ318_004928 [Aromia moschata]|uniref:Small ribosomal subunit protein uS7 domain-containing protein n=1 Tax=Aromia moschata TaxID=1265417 RepID=A0AAV8Z007_9CUCU|nr:hypothetical protein NQ318_004928 [Aromia moschata]
MATLKTMLGKCQIFNSRTKVISCLFNQQNGMSQYPKVQEELIKSGEAHKLSHVPTRAALNDQTSSLAHDNLVNLFINYCMRDGKKVLARGLIEQAFENIKRLQLEKYHKCDVEEDKNKIELNPKLVFHRAIQNCKPVMQLTPIKRGGVPITEKKSQFLSMKWLIAAAKEKDGNTRFHLQLARELIDASNYTGRVIKKKQDLHKQCEANRAYAHYRWS